jgi:hypothetical protein
MMKKRKRISRLCRNRLIQQLMMTMNRIMIFDNIISVNILTDKTHPHHSGSWA